MTVGTSINDEVDGISAPGMGQIRLFGHGMAARRSFIDRINLPATVRCKLIACDTDPNHTFGVGKTSYGESRNIGDPIKPRHRGQNNTKTPAPEQTDNRTKSGQMPVQRRSLK
jgi:hypothetical protein